MNEEQGVGTPLREEGVVLHPPYPKRLTVGHKIQRVWALLFGKHNDELRPVWVTRDGLLGTSPVPLTDMIYVTGGTLVPDTGLNLGAFADLIIADGYCELSYTPELIGAVGAVNYNFVAQFQNVGGFYDDAGAVVAIWHAVLHAHVDHIKSANSDAVNTIYFHAYAYPPR